MNASLRVRRVGSLAVSVAIPLLLTSGCGHRGVHAARNLLVPGAGLIDDRPVLAAGFVVLAIAATVSWLTYGTDWVLAALVGASMAASAILATADHPTAAVVRSAHEFPIVVLVVAALSWARTTVSRVPWLARRPTRAAGSVDRCRAAAIRALTGDVGAACDVLADPAMLQRARRINRVARGRWMGDPARIDHAPIHTLRLLTGSPSHNARLSALGAPCTEPTWVRPLDAVLFHRAAGTDPQPILQHEFGRRGSHRPAWYWTPLGIGAGRMPTWEHALTVALATTPTADEWAGLRRPALGAAARGVANRYDERLIAAARLWLPFVDDEPAARIINRPTIRHDVLAVAIDHLAHSTTGAR